MNMEERKLSNVVRVWSLEDSVGFTPVTDAHEPRWIWKRNPYESECYFDVRRKLLEAEIRSSVALRNMLEDGTLLIKDSKIIKDFHLEEVSEYIKDKDELKDFILTCSEEELEDYLQYAPDTMLVNIETIFTKVELNSRAKIKLIKLYTGVDLEEFYKDMDEEGVDVQGDKANKKSTGKKQARKPMAEK